MKTEAKSKEIEKKMAGLSESSEISEKSEQSEKSALPEQSEKSEGSAQSELPELPEQSEQSEKSESSEKSEQSKEPEDLESSDSSDDSDSAKSAESSDPAGQSELVRARIEGYARGRGLPPEVIEAAVADLVKIGEAVASGNLDLDMLELIITGRDHKRLMAEAVREAELKGRNTAIEAKMRETVSDDGLPHLASSGSSRRTSRRSIFSLAQSAR